MSDREVLQECLRQIEAKLGWGPASGWSNADFETLSERILAKTQVNLSPTTLKRVWGRVAYRSQPSTTTLDALAVFAGHENYRAYRTTLIDEPTATAPIRTRAYARYALILVPLVVIGVIALLVLPGVSKAPASPPKFNPEDFTFDIRPVTQGIPNSVVFTYDAAAAGDSSVFLQQSWDPNRRERLDPSGHTHTSIYYLPGFYRAKLVVGDQIVQERKLFLPSRGWVAAAYSDGVPVYLKPTEVERPGELAITAGVLEHYGVPMQPNPPATALVNVRDIQGLRTDDFVFRTRFRQTYAEGSAACRRAAVSVLLQDGVIRLPFSAPGCVSDLTGYAGGVVLDGRKQDLSAFGVMTGEWTELEIDGNADSLRVNVNGAAVLSLARTEPVREIIGVQFDFAGTGATKQVMLGREGDWIWEENW